ncbi:jg21200 [Pararge aegeria aegeria]|uniref:Jg21200 protein n=1 Tax=Pararge aegeria aegeria TaxID=348720 RepID=A0A8S4RCQ9_9NEOP|nr:jg21200 [Pararge aegeria aegeria]
MARTHPRKIQHTNTFSQPVVDRAAVVRRAERRESETTERRLAQGWLTTELNAVKPRRAPCACPTIRLLSAKETATTERDGIDAVLVGARLPRKCLFTLALKAFKLYESENTKAGRAFQTLAVRIGNVDEKRFERIACMSTT